MADLIIVLAGNTIAETGSHQQLVAADGTYADLYRLQAAACQTSSSARRSTPVSINAITLIVEQPSTIAHRLRDAFGWIITQDFGAFAELTTGNGAVLWLNVPSEPTTALQQGVIVHCHVDDVTSAANKARTAGATILREPTTMDFGMESAWAQVQDGPIVDLTRPL